MTAEVDPYLLDYRGQLKVWMVYERWRSEEPGTEIEFELRALLMNQSSFKPYAKSIFDGPQPDFDPYAGCKSKFKQAMYKSLQPIGDILVLPVRDFVKGTEPILNLLEVDPEVLAILVSIYPKEMLFDSFENSCPFSCTMNLIYIYSSNRRAKALLRVVSSVQKFPLQKMVQYGIPSVYLNPETISVVVGNSRTYQVWDHISLQKLIPYIRSPKLMQLFYEVSSAQCMIISTKFFEESLKLGVSIKQINRCKFYYTFDYREELTELFKQILLLNGVEDEQFVFDFMRECAGKTGRCRWGAEDDMVAAELGYSQLFRDKMSEIVSEVNLKQTNFLPEMFW